MVGSVFSLSGSFATGRNVAPDGNSARLLGGAGATLHNLENSRTATDRIRVALTQLRAALQDARDGADPVPGRSALKPVIAQVEDTVDKPTFVTINGNVVQDGTITVSLGKRPLVVGYERTPRASLDARDALNTLAATVGSLVATVGAKNTGGFVDKVSTLLSSGDLATAVSRPDSSAIDNALGRIDAVLAGAEGLRSSLAGRQSAAAQVDLGGLLLGATGDVFTGAGGATEQPGGSVYSSSTGDTAGTQFSILS